MSSSLHLFFSYTKFSSQLEKRYFRMSLSVFITFWHLCQTSLSLLRSSFVSHALFEDWWKHFLQLHQFRNQDSTASQSFFFSLLLWNARIALSFKHEYFCAVRLLVGRSSSAFLIFQSCLQKGFFRKICISNGMQWIRTIMMSCFHIRMF